MKLSIEFIEKVKTPHNQLIIEIANVLKNCVVDYKEDFLITITLVDNKTIKDINLQFREIDKETDILSFPILENKKGELLYKSYDINHETNTIFLGDLIISYEKIITQAKDYGHSFERETAFLLVHGMLHLIGYDHVTDEDEKMMRNIQNEILDKAGYNR
ncbi:MAG: rRNA maturation RNase YbeY [Clostridiales bacterium]|nr:rRNA maturation RNase YbeY [Clostridiales bacterium]